MGKFEKEPASSGLVHATQEGIAIDLLDAGIPAHDIVLGFRPADLRPFTMLPILYATPVAAKCLSRQRDSQNFFSRLLQVGSFCKTRNEHL